MITPFELEYREIYGNEFVRGCCQGRVKSWQVKRKGSGLYVIKENNVIMYIGMSQTAISLTAYRHFQDWKDTKQRRITYKWSLHEHKYTLAILECEWKQALIIEQFWINLIVPRDNHRIDKCALPPAEKIDMSAVPF